jgi:spore germination protein KB
MFTIGAFIKMNIYLLVCCKGIAKVLKCNDYRFIVLPISLLMINLAYFEFESMIDYYDFVEVWYWYASFFEVLLPITILITIELKKKSLFHHRSWGRSC